MTTHERSPGHPAAGGQPAPAQPPGRPRPDASLWSPEDRWGMALALEQARRAAAEGEVPVGAVLVRGAHLVARGHNRTRGSVDPTAHAELLAIRSAARREGFERLPEATVYTTLEPCFMCAGALLQARVGRVVWAARDPKFGALVSLGQVLSDPRANHRCDLAEGLGARESGDLLVGFFRQRRGGGRT